MVPTTYEAMRRPVPVKQRRLKLVDTLKLPCLFLARDVLDCKMSIEIF